MLKKRVFLSLCLLVGGLYLITPYLDGVKSNSYHDLQYPKVADNQDSRFNLALQFVNHDPILIDGNGNFIATATTEGWSGDGTFSNPYIIDGLSIDSSPRGTSISISNTDRYFKIENCLISGEVGISFSNVKNGAIFNNTLKNTIGGNNERSGIIFSDHSSYNAIVDNTLFNFEFPLDVRGNNNLIEHTQLYDNINGIFVQGNNNIIANNTVQDATGGSGLDISNSVNNTISHNLLIQNHRGINLKNSNNSKIISNFIRKNNIGVLFDLKSENNSVAFNIFSSNFELESQAGDNGTSNTFDHNFWNEWTGPDDDVNGIVDDIYLVEGSAGNADSFPLVSASLIDSLHILSLPALTQPTEGEPQNDTSKLAWNSAYDSFDHSISYTLYYSLNNGDDWILIIANLTETAYVWDTSSLASGSEILVKIVGICSDGLIVTYISETFIMRGGDLSSILQAVALFVLFSLSIGIGGYLVYNAKVRSSQGFSEILQSAPTDFLKALYRKVVIGLDSIASGVIPELQAFPVLEPPAESSSLIEYFPSDIRHDLLSKLKGRSVLTLIEIAYQYPDNIHPLKLSEILDIAPSTLSNEIKRLITLEYIKPETIEKSFHDARYRYYSLTPKGANFLYLLKGILNTAIGRMREHNPGVR